MKNVMVRAWEIAKAGVAKFGGKVKEYFAQALVMAWAEIKKGGKIMKAVLETLTGSKKSPTWVAKIKGLNNTYKFDREFISEVEGNIGYKEFNLYSGNVYDVCDGGNRKYVKIVNGKIIEIEENEVAAYLA